jgi:hypothetical protein
MAFREIFSEHHNAKVQSLKKTEMILKLEQPERMDMTNLKG